MSVTETYPWVAERFSVVGEEQAGRYLVCDCPLRCHTCARVRFTLSAENVLLFKCMRECSKLDMLRAVGAAWRDCWPGGRMPDRPPQEIVARYPYADEQGRVLYQTVRQEPGLYGRDKDFRQRRPHPSGRGWVWNLEGVRRVLYRLPEVMRADPARPVFVVGGEKDVESLRSVGLLATTNVCGERAEWLESYSAALAGRDVVAVEDRDAAGRRHSCEVRGSLMDHARSVRCVRFPEKDATAFLMKLRQCDVTTPAALREYVLGAVEESPKWAPSEGA